MELTGIKKTYEKKEILKGIDLDVKEEELLVILGSSGSGKSTLLKIIAGIETADEGKVMLHGEDITNISLQKRGVGYIFQEPLLFPHMTVLQNVSYSLEMAKVQKGIIKEKAKKYMELLQIQDLANHMPNQLSGGQKQRVSIARALINSPKILLMDEPFSSLDYNLRREMGEMLIELKKELGLTVIFVTHDIQESMLLGDRIGFLHQGTLLEVKSPQSLYYEPEYEETAKFMGEYNLIEGRVEKGDFVCKYGTIPIANMKETITQLYIRPNKITVKKSMTGRYRISDIKWRGKDIRISMEGEPLIIDTPNLEELRKGDFVDVIMRLA